MILFQNGIYVKFERLRWPVKKVWEELDILILFLNRYVLFWGGGSFAFACKMQCEALSNPATLNVRADKIEG